MKPSNLVIIMSDEHNPKVMGCNGHPLVKTPNIDALAAGGTMFNSAYTTCPVCVPARAAFAVGKYVHQIGYWDNADAYEARFDCITGARAAPRRVDRQAASAALRRRQRLFEEIIDEHHRGQGRSDGVGGTICPSAGSRGRSPSSRPRRESSFYDREIATKAQIWLREEAPKYRDKPWILFVSFVCPHFPLIAPAEFYYQYPLDQMPVPKQYAPHERPDHPYLRDYAGSFVYDRFFDSDKLRKAIAAYYGLCTFLDDNIGKVLRALDATGLAATTRVLYTSDHGDNLGARGLGVNRRCTSRRAPLIISGPAARNESQRARNHVDTYPFIMERRRTSPRLRHQGTRYSSSPPAKPDRNMLTEYHSVGSTTGAFMIRQQMQILHYVAYRPQLFDLEADPEELHDLAQNPAYADTVAECCAVGEIYDPPKGAARKTAGGRLQNGGRDMIKRGDLGFAAARISGGLGLNARRMDEEIHDAGSFDLCAVGAFYGCAGARLSQSGDKVARAVCAGR
jgi:choline-sulfatase